MGFSRANSQCCAVNTAASSKQGHDPSCFSISHIQNAFLMAQLFLLNLTVELCIRICVADAQLGPVTHGRNGKLFPKPEVSLLKNIVILQQCCVFET